MNLEQRNTELEEKLKASDLSKAVDVLIKDAKRRKRQVRGLAISLILDVLLTIGLGVTSVLTHQIATASESNHQAIVRSCETGNEARAKNREIWDYVIQSTSQAPTTPEGRVFREKFVTKVNDTFTPRDCNNIK